MGKFINWWNRKKYKPISPQPEATHGLTCDKSIKLNKDPTLPALNKHTFYRTIQNNGPFELRKVEHISEHSGPSDPYYIVYSAQVHREFRISKYWFDILFEQYN